MKLGSHLPYNLTVVTGHLPTQAIAPLGKSCVTSHLHQESGLTCTTSRKVERSHTDVIDSICSNVLGEANVA